MVEKIMEKKEGKEKKSQGVEVADPPSRTAPGKS